MDKILISLYVPSLRMSWDLFVPENLMIRELIKLLIDGVTDLSGGKYKSSGKELLCVQEPGMLLSDSLCLRAYGIQNGEKLILF